MFSFPKMLFWLGTERSKFLVDGVLGWYVARKDTQVLPTFHRYSIAEREYNWLAFVFRAI